MSNVPQVCTASDLKTELDSLRVECVVEEARRTPPTRAQLCASVTHPRVIDPGDDVRGSAPVRPISRVQGYNKLEILHHRWGHASEHAIKTTLMNKAVLGAGATYEQIKDLKLGFCQHCYEGKMTELPTHQQSLSQWNVLEKICVDYKGPFPVQTYDGKTGMLLFVDQRSSYTKAYLVESKTELLDCLKDFVNLIGKVNKKCRAFQTDTEKTFITEPIRQ